jgi:rubrerythrin
MGKIAIVDTVGDSRETLQQALEAAGWEVVIEDGVHCCDVSVEAIVLATDAAGLATAHHQVETLRETRGTPVILVTEMDRSGWDRTFEAPQGLAVDALLDKPVDVHALLRRLKGILQARQDAQGARETPEMDSILDRAIADEEAAEDFYRRAAELVEAPETKEALESLARDEREHKELLQEFRSGARPLPEGESPAGALVEAMGTPEFTTDMAPADAFLLAANKERLAVEMYENWARLYPSGPEHEVLLKLAEVERRHKAHVEAMFSDAAFPEAW